MTAMARLNPHQAALDRDVLSALRRIEIQQAMLDVEAEYPIPQSVLDMTLRPVDVAYIRKEMVDWWSQAGEWQHRFALQGRRPIDPNDDNDVLDAEHTRRWTEDGFRESELFWVSPDMTQLVTAMYPTVPDCIPTPPCKNGFVVFARSIPGLDAESGGEIYTTAYLWRTVETKLGWCWGIETYAWREMIHTWRMMSDESRLRYRQVMPMRLHPTGGSEWPVDSMTTDFSVIPATTPSMEASMLEDRRILATFWALCSQKIAVKETWLPNRNIRRQAQREGWKSIPPSVRVIRLREMESKGAGAGSDIEWSHRWIVGSHWRNQWYPSRQEHAPKLIDAYQKGPADKPLLIRDTVKALVR